MASNLRRAAVLGAVAAALAPATASASAPQRPVAQAPTSNATYATAGKLELGATVLAGGSVALLVFGTIGMATIGERRHMTTAR
jgi:hypothetical protein